jgi:hypothetical protein
LGGVGCAIEFDVIFRSAVFVLSFAVGKESRAFIVVWGIIILINL